MENNFIEIYFNQEHSIQYNIWKATTKNATWQEMQKTMLFYSSALELYKPKFILVSEKKLLYAWIPENQEWIDQIIVPILLKLEIQKFAIVQNEDIFHAVAVEQLMNEENAKNLETRFFDNFEEAENWLISQKQFV